jgi:hypothetical protein
MRDRATRKHARPPHRGQRLKPAIRPRRRPARALGSVPRCSQNVGGHDGRSTARMKILSETSGARTGRGSARTEVRSRMPRRRRVEARIFLGTTRDPEDLRQPFGLVREGAVGWETALGTPICREAPPARPPPASHHGEDDASIHPFDLADYPIEAKLRRSPSALPFSIPGKRNPDRDRRRRGNDAGARAARGDRERVRGAGGCA